MLHSQINVLFGLRITNQPTAEERMLNVVEWYLTSFHEGRKVSFIFLLAYGRLTERISQDIYSYADMFRLSHENLFLIL